MANGVYHLHMKVERVILAADHAGFALKEKIKAYLSSKKIDVTDVSPHVQQDDDSPPIIRKGCKEVLSFSPLHKGGDRGEGVFGIIVGGSGNGEAMVGNKMKGIRAAVCWNEEIARLARAHNDANVMSLGGRYVEEKLAKKMVDIFLETEFEGGRHERRVREIEPFI